MPDQLYQRLPLELKALLLRDSFGKFGHSPVPLRKRVRRTTSKLAFPFAAIRQVIDAVVGMAGGIEERHAVRGVVAGFLDLRFANQSATCVVDNIQVVGGLQDGELQCPCARRVRSREHAHGGRWKTAWIFEKTTFAEPRFWPCWKSIWWRWTTSRPRRASMLSIPRGFAHPA